MATSAGDRMVNAGVAGADHMKIQTAEALEDAANKMSTWVMESRHLSSTKWKLAKAIDAARKVLP